LSEDRQEKLRDLGFVFDLHKAAWMEKYEELVEFKNYFGHCIVPNEDTANPDLGKWVDHQRQQYSRRIRELGSGMTEERVELLEAIEFCWSLVDAKWEGHFEDLKEHVRMHGYGVRPPAKSRTLVDWVGYQRKVYRQKQDGKQVSLTTKRLQKLRSLGFCL
jgi:hypothetical protein